MKRLSKENYFMTVAYAASLRSTCPRRHVGAVLVDEYGIIIGTGYNGAPSGMAHCEDVGCLTLEGSKNCINTIHAENNAITHSKGLGVALYSTDLPCLNCLKVALAHNPQIMIYYWRYYQDDARDLFVAHHHLEERFMPLSWTPETLR